MSKSIDSYSKRGSVDKRHPQHNVIRTRDRRLLKVMGYMIKGMLPIIETTNSMRKATLKKESFEPAKNLRKTSDGLRMLSAMCTLLNQYGKDNFKPIMKESFNNITHTDNSVTEKLFGDDLQKKLRKIIISNFDDKLSGSCVRGGFSGFRGGFSLILD